MHTLKNTVNFKFFSASMNESGRLQVRTVCAFEWKRFRDNSGPGEGQSTLVAALSYVNELYLLQKEGCFHNKVSVNYQNIKAMILLENVPEKHKYHRFQPNRTSIIFSSCEMNAAS